jgi:hypothetical protein
LPARLRCAVCGRSFCPDRRNRGRQSYCSRRCRREAKRRYDRKYHRAYRRTWDGRLHRREQHRRYRGKVGWSRYVRYWRKRDSYRTEVRERKRARRYYERHREEILAKRRRQRVVQKASREPCSH